MQGPGFSDSKQGVFGIFTIPGNTIQPGDTYTACASDSVNAICKRLTHSPGDSDSVVISL
jgi:hypothetical protein